MKDYQALAGEMRRAAELHFEDSFGHPVTPYDARQWAEDVDALAAANKGAVGDAQQLAAAVRFLLLQPHKTVPHPDVVQEIVDRYPECAEPCAALPRKDQSDDKA